MVEATVVIPTKDRPALLARTVATVLAQDHVELEVLVVDDGSDEPVTAGALASDSRLAVLRNDHPQGAPAARNRGLEAARGTWTAFVDDDDLWRPAKLRSQLAAAGDAGSEWAFSGAILFTQGPGLWSLDPPGEAEYILGELPWRYCIPAGSSNVVARTEVLRHAGGFAEDTPFLADWDLSLKLLRTGPPGIARSLDVAYRVHQTSMTGAAGRRVLEEMDLLDARTRDLRGGLPLDHRPLLYWLGSHLWLLDQRRASRDMYRLALELGYSDARRRLARTLIPVRRLRPRSRTPQPWPPDVLEWLQEADRSGDS